MYSTSQGDFRSTQQSSISQKNSTQGQFKLEEQQKKYDIVLTASNANSSSLFNKTEVENLESSIGQGEQINLNELK